MSDTVSLFIYLLNCFINGQKPEKVFNNIDWDNIAELAKIHCVEGMIWSVLKNSEIYDIPQNIRNDFENALVFTINNSIRQEIAIKHIKNKLNEFGVKHIFMKGSVVKNYYPIKELRTMGDIDYLIEEENRELCHKAMLELGYELEVKGASVWEYRNNLAYVEVHNKIIYQKLFLGIDYSEYFSDVLENLVCIEKNTYEMQPEYHFVYIIVHLAKHLYRVGCGVRMVMDIPIFVKHFGENLNWRVLEERFREINMWDFVQKLLYVCVKYFDCRLPENVYKVDDYVAENLMAYILEAGIFGGYNRDEYAVKFGADNAGKKGIKKCLGKMGKVFEMIFPDYKSMCRWYVWFDGKPKWLLPWGWAKRLFLQLRYKRESIKSKLTGAVVDNDEGKKHHDIMSMIGLNK